MPVRACAHSVMMRGMSGMFLRYKLVRQPLHGDGLDERIRDDDFLFAQRGRVAVVGRLRVGLQQFADARQAGQELDGQGVRDGPQALLRQFGRRVVFEALADFVFQAGEHRFQQRRSVSALISEEWMSFSSKKPGNSSRSKSIVMSAMARLEGRFLPSRWLMPPALGVGSHQAVG